MGSILLVAPDPETTQCWSTALAAANHSVLIADSMRAAPVLVGEGGIDVVVIDCYGQCAGVVELARTIELLPDAPPIILVSSSPIAPEISARIGAAAFLAKPCEPSEITTAVTRLLGQLRPVRIVEDEPTGRKHAG